jgi:hypothetical protein
MVDVLTREVFSSMCTKLLRGVAVCVLAAGVVGCESKAGTGALIGAGGGALAGGAIGSMSHARAGEGALIGAGIGAIGGALIGHSMDESDKKKNQDRYAERDYDRRHSTASGSGAPQTTGVSKGDIIAWTQQGTRDDLIIDRIERSGTVFHLTAADESDLRDRGVSESVIRAMRDTQRRY